jgi:hypothetical protein
MSASSHGYAVIGFNVYPADLCFEEDLGKHCTRGHGSMRGRHCSECGALLVPNIKRTWKPEAHALAKALGGSLGDEPLENNPLDEYPFWDHKGGGYLGVCLRPGCHSAEKVEEAFARAEELKAILLPDGSRKVVLAWHHELSW